jgi:GNAT superfamily N-acetyltransferase
MSLAATKIMSPALPPIPADVEVRRVETRADREAFIELEFQLYAGDPNWVPHLRIERRDLLNTQKNPWFEFGTAELYLARKGGKVVGRIAGVHDPRYNDFHQTQLGFFGLFECINDAGVARALFDAAGAFNERRGFTQMLGPFNFSTNYECSVLVDGFDSPPSFMMAYNPRYYPALYEACGLAKAKDLFAWDLSSSVEPPERVVKLVQRVRTRNNVVVRPVSLKHFERDIAKIKQVYNSAWERNWGFVPMTDREFNTLAKEMKPIAKPDLVFIAEVEGEPVAFAMTLPDINPAFKAANGKLLPFGLIKLLWKLRSIKRARLMTLGIRAEYRKRGIDAVLYYETLMAAKRLGYTGGEISWTLEDNTLINNAIEVMGGRKYKTYRVYERPTRL